MPTLPPDHPYCRELARRQEAARRATLPLDPVSKLFLLPFQALGAVIGVLLSILLVAAIWGIPILLLRIAWAIL